MAKLYPTIIVTALSQGVFSQCFITMMENAMDGTDIKDKNQEPDALLCMIGLGVGEIGGAIAFGKIQDSMTHQKTIFINVIAAVISSIVLILYAAIYKFTFYFSIIMTVTWGV